MPLFILENSFRAHAEEGVIEGSTLHREEEWPTARATRAMTVSVIRVRGSVKNVSVKLGDEDLEPGVGLTTLDPPRQIAEGTPLDISFSGDGAIEMACEREAKR